MNRLFLTSNIGGYVVEDGNYRPYKMDSRNQFLENLKQALPNRRNCLMVSAYPDNAIMNDGMVMLQEAAFAMSGLPLDSIAICDDRNRLDLGDLLTNANLVILCGGHVPTQNRFFTEIHLREQLERFDGVVIGISAGSMNSAALVYAQPGLDGEATDLSYQRFITGLGLTDIRILPHYEELKEAKLDGLRFIEDIGLPDSMKHPFYALVDGSYILCDGKTNVLYGEGYLVAGGTIKQICLEGESTTLETL